MGTHTRFFPGVGQIRGLGDRSPILGPGAEPAWVWGSRGAASEVDGTPHDNYGRIWSYVGGLGT